MIQPSDNCLYIPLHPAHHQLPTRLGQLLHDLEGDTVLHLLNKFTFEQSLLNFNGSHHHLDRIRPWCSVWRPTFQKCFLISSNKHVLHYSIRSQNMRNLRCTLSHICNIYIFDLISDSDVVFLAVVSPLCFANET